MKRKTKWTKFLSIGGGIAAIAGMREWAEENGQFIALDDFYDSVTFLAQPALGEPIAPPHYAVPVDFNQRR